MKKLIKLKKCSTCKQEKPLSEFYSSSKHKDGKTYNCKECYHIYYLEHSNVNYRKEKNEIINVMKRCPKCKKIKSIDEFYKDKNTKSGVRSWCKECRKRDTIRYYNENKEKCSAYSKEYNIKNKSKIKIKGKKYRERIKKMDKDIPEYEECGSCHKIKHYTEFYKNSENINGLCYRCKECSKIADYNRKDQRAEFYRTEKQKEKRRKRDKKRWDNDPIYRLQLSYRNYLSRALRKNMISKNASALKYLGCTIQELRMHLESQFQPEMTWDNYNYYGWHVDHIKPVSAFDLLKESEIEKCFHYTNLQPLWGKENIEKNAKYEENTK